MQTGRVDGQDGDSGTLDLGRLEFQETRLWAFQRRRFCFFPLPALATATGSQRHATATPTLSSVASMR